jgi:16S rRNA (uracil1498-N3)-methyltransferase
MVQRITISADQQVSSLIALREDQVHYLVRVLRLRVGDRFLAQTAQGQQWLAAISEQPNQAHVLEAIAPAQAPTAPLRLIAALPKGNSFDQVVRQTTELGVTHIYPVVSDRTLLKPKGNKLERWRRIAQEACEQSERVTAPEIFEPVDYLTFMKRSPWEGAAEESAPEEGASDSKSDTQEKAKPKKDPHELRYICTARRESPHLLAHLLDYQRNTPESADLHSVALAIGPEGGWTSHEITVAIEQGYKVVSLGGAILRAVTAPITALSLVAAARELLI